MARYSYVAYYINDVDRAEVQTDEERARHREIIDKFGKLS